MLPFKLVYSKKYFLPLGEHIFHADKFRLIRKRLLQEQVAEEGDFLAPGPVGQSDVLLVHTPQYLKKLMEGGLSVREELEMEIPYSPRLVDAFLLHAGGSVLAAERALEDGVCFNIGGGFHHAFPDHGEGFCMIHDFAIAIRALQKRGRIQRAMIVDCDVHQGNGTAAIFNSGSAGGMAGALPSHSGATLGAVAESPTNSSPNDVFTISLHQENNYPYVKPASSIDVNLHDGCEDAEYLGWLDNALSSGLRQSAPELICYVAGADPFSEDQLGGLNLSIAGLKRRDEMVFRAARAHKIPVMVTCAGGYALNFEDTITIHCNTVRAAAEVCRTTAPQPG